MTKHNMGTQHEEHVQQSVTAPNGKASSVRDHSHYPALPDLTRIRALSQERPSRKMALIRREWPHIVAALNAGHTLKLVCQRLNEDGVAIDYKTLSAYVNILRRKQRQVVVS